MSSPAATTTPSRETATGRATPATTTDCPFRERFDRRPPRGFAEEASGMDWRTMLDTFAPSEHRFHLADLTRRPLGRGITAYEAIVAVRDPEGTGFTARRITTESCGELTAMSEMLGRVGAGVEIERFHQYEGRPFDSTGSWCTILRASCGRRQTWSMGFGRSPDEASVAALLSAATRLHLR